MKVGERYVVKMETYGDRGDTLGRHNGRVVFVTEAIPGEEVEVEIVSIKRRHVRGKVVKVLSPSPDRAEPQCRYFGECGGCQFQHIAYEKQLEIKYERIREALQNQGGFSDPPLEPVIPSPQPYGYRNHLNLHGPGKPGFWRVGGRGILQIEECAIAHSAINGRIRELQESDEEVPENILFRCSLDGTVFSGPEGGDWAKEAILEEKITLPSGLSLTIQIPASVFWQVNSYQIPNLIGQVRTMYLDGGLPNVVDAYAGVGIFSLFLAGDAEKCISIEENPNTVRAGRSNTRRLGITNCRFMEGKTEDSLRPALRESRPEKTCLILDPDRGGCTPQVIETIRRYCPPQVIYATCNPPIQAGELKKLSQTGYTLHRVVPIDLFPQTRHCEVIADLRLSR